MSHTDASLMALQPQPKAYKVGLGKGLYCFVTPSGVRSLRTNYTYAGSQRTHTFGQHGPQLLIEGALLLLLKLREDIAAGIDPAAAKERQHAIEAPAEGRLADEGGHYDKATKMFLPAKSWLAEHAKTITHEYARKIGSMLSRNVYPTLGKRRLDDVTAPDLVNLAKAVVLRGAPRVARDMAIYVCAIYVRAKNEGRCKTNPAEDLSESKAIPSRKPRHMARVPAELLGTALADIRKYQPRRIGIGLELLLLWAPRTNTLRQLRRSWIKMDEVRVPWRAMKGTKNEAAACTADFRIPLTAHTRGLLDELCAMAAAETSEVDFPLFPNRRDVKRCLSDAVFRHALAKIGWTGEADRPHATVHGFRSLFATLAKTEWAKTVPETKAVDRQLDHIDPDKVNAAYERDQDGGHRGMYLQERRRLMEWWEARVLKGCPAIVTYGDYWHREPHEEPSAADLYAG